MDFLCPCLKSFGLGSCQYVLQDKVAPGSEEVALLARKSYACFHGFCGSDITAPVFPHISTSFLPGCGPPYTTSPSDTVALVVLPRVACTLNHRGNRCGTARVLGLTYILVHTQLPAVTTHPVHMGLVRMF